MSTKRTGIAEILLWVFIVVLILLSFTPFALGFKIKTDYSQLINDVSKISQLDIQIVRYDRGIFSSHVVLGLNFPNMPEQIQFNEEIIHGPVYFGLLNQGKSPLVAAVVKGQLDVNSTQQEMIQKVFAGNNPLVYQEIISFSGDVEAQAYIPAINTSFEDELGQVTIQSAGIVINEYYSAVKSKLMGDASIPLFKVDSALFSVNAQTIEVSFSGSMGMNEVLVGDSVASMSSLNIDSEDDQFALRDLVVRSVTSENGNLINSGTQITATEILASNQKFGPVQFNLSLNGINAQSLNQLQQMQKELEQKIQQGIPPEQINAMMTGQIMGLIPDLIKQAEIKINPLSVDSELGKLEADMDFSLEGIDANTPADPMFLLGAINLDLNFSIDESLLKQFISWELENNQQSGLYAGSAENKKAESEIPLEQKVSENIKGMLDENWLVLNEGVYLSKINMHQGELLINDKSVDPMQKVMSSMGAGGELAAP